MALDKTYTESRNNSIQFMIIIKMHLLHAQKKKSSGNTEHRVAFKTSVHLEIKNSY